MSEYLAPIEVLIEKFRTLPGVGRKTAARFALSVLDMTNEQCEDFAQALLDAKSKIHRCPRCQNLTDLPLCSICLDESRARVICVVEDAKALMSIERIRDYRGRYHVLDAVLSPIKGIGPKQIGLEKLVARIADENIEEVIREEIGLVFSKVLECAGVYKRTAEGKAAFLRFVDAVNGKEV